MHRDVDISNIINLQCFTLFFNDNNYILFRMAYHKLNNKKTYRALDVL